MNLSNSYVDSSMVSARVLLLDNLLVEFVLLGLFYSKKVPEERKKGMPSDQPQLKRVTTTALLGSCVQQPIKDMTSLGTDFEIHANWQGNVEEPAAKDFVVRKARTIA
jgi:hypothetical protein